MSPKSPLRPRLLFAGLAGVLLFLGLGAWLHLRTPSASSPAAVPGPGSSLASAESRPTAAAPAAPAQPAALYPKNGDSGRSPAASASWDRPLRERFRIRRVVLVQDTPPAGADGRFERVEVLETDFQYPLVRFTSTVRRDPATGHEQVTGTAAMVADHVMVKPRAGKSAAEVAAALTQAGLAVRGTVADGAVLLVEFPVTAATGDRLPAVLEQLGAAGAWVEVVEPDLVVTAQEIVPNDPQFGSLWGLHNTGQVGQRSVKGLADQDIDGPEAWSITTDASTVLVAVVDTGIRTSHQELTANLWINAAESGNGRETDGIDQDGNGYVDDVYGGNAINRTGDVWDNHGHGTHIAGTIAAAGNNGVGIAGVAWKAKLMAVRFLDDNGSAPISAAIEGLSYARRMGAKIVNASWGGPFDSELARAAFAECGASGMLMVCAAGNFGMDGRLREFYPAAYDFPFQLSIAASTSVGTLASFSNYGTAHLAAPGVDILSCGILGDDDYRWSGGTSMAAPHVVGVAALVWAQHPQESAAQIARRVISGATESPLLGRPLRHARLLNLHRPLAEPNAPQLPYVALGARTVRAVAGDDVSLRAEITTELPVTCQWYRNEKPIGGATARELRLNPVSRAEAGSYFVEVTNAAGVSRSSSQILFVDGPPLILSQPAATSVYAGNDTILSVTAIGVSDEPLSYQWTRNDLAVAGGTFGTLAVRHATGSDAGAYRVSITSRFGTTISELAVLTVLPAQAPVVTTPPAALTVTADEDARFSAAVEGTPVLAYQWFKDGAPLEGATEPEWRIRRAQAADAGDYTLVASNPAGSVTSAAARLTVRTAPVAPFIVRPPQPLAADFGASATLSVLAKGTPTPTYQWSRDGTELPGATGATLTLDRVSAAHLGEYRVVVRNASGSASSAPVRLTLRSGGVTGGWQWRVPAPHGNDLHAGLFTQGRFVVVGRFGTILTSTDGIVWTPRVSGTVQTLNGIVQHGSRLWVVGAKGTVLVSADGGITWSGQPKPTNLDLERIAYGNGRFVVSCQSSGTVLYSTDGFAWTVRSSPASRLQLGAFGRGYFHFVSDADGLLRRTPDGETWETIDTGRRRFVSLAYADGLFLAMDFPPPADDPFTAIWSSTDGETWAPRHHFKDTPGWRGQFWRLGDLWWCASLDAHHSSPDGHTWTRRHPGLAPANLAFVGGMAYGNGVGVAFSTLGEISSSTDRLSWIPRGSELRLGGGFETAVFHEGKFFARLNANIHSSADGVLWNVRAIGLRPRRMVVSEGEILGYDDTLNAVVKSRDGAAWTSHPFPGADVAQVGVTRAGGRYVAVGRKIVQLHPTPIYQAFAATSTDLITWVTPDIAALGGGLNAVLHDGTRFVAVGFEQTVLSSVDGVAWTKEHGGSTRNFETVAFSGTTYVASSDAGVELWTSKDRRTWTLATLPASELAEEPGAFSLHYGFGQFLALHANGGLYASRDGNAWTLSYAGTNRGKLVLGSDTLLSVGGNGIVQSGPMVASLQSARPTPQRQTVAAGRALQLALDTFGLQSLTYQWLKDGVELSGQTRPTLEIAAARDTDAGIYTVRLMDGAAGAISQPAYLSVVETTTRFTNEGGIATARVWAPAGLMWTLGTTSSWVRTRGRQSGVGNGFVEFTVDANTTGVARSTTVVVGGESIRVSQAGLSTGRLLALSARAKTPGGNAPLIGGALVTGATPRRVLVRGIGRTLREYGVTAALADTTLGGFRGTTEFARDTGTATRPAARDAALEVGAFPLSDTDSTGRANNDSALVTLVSAGPATFQLAPVTGAGGVGLLELYDADLTLEGGLRGLSARALTGSGEDVLTGGIAIGGTAPQRLLVRALGPALVKYGVTDALVDPGLQVFSGTVLQATNDNWGDNADSAELQATAQAMGLEPLGNGSKDAAVFLTLPPGAYTFQVKSGTGLAGTALFEIYAVD